MMRTVVNIQCSNNALPGVARWVERAQNSGAGVIPSLAISCFTVERKLATECSNFETIYIKDELTPCVNIS
jgi:hypothetical protein